MSEFQLLFIHFGNICFKFVIADNRAIQKFKGDILLQLYNLIILDRKITRTKLGDQLSQIRALDNIFNFKIF